MMHWAQGHLEGVLEAGGGVAEEKLPFVLHDILQLPLHALGGKVCGSGEQMRRGGRSGDGRIVSIQLFRWTFRFQF